MGDFVLPDGGHFDTTIGLGPVVNSFCSYGKFLDATKERLKRYGRVAKKIDAIQSIHSEVGDDEIDVSTTPIYAAAELAVYSDFLGVKVSEEDTSINPRFGNFAEDLVIVPDGYEQTYHYSQQTSNFRDMSFLDVPKLRLAIDIRPGRMSHSATNDGKAGMLGSRLAWLPANSPVRCMWEVFNLFQDINLGLMRDDKFAYLPTALGGYGKPIPFSHGPNFEAIIVRYKQGTHQGLCRELLRRTNRRFRNYSVTGRYSSDEVLSAVSRVQSSWHDWIKGKSLYAPTCWLEAPPEVAQYRVAKHGADTLTDGVLRRLEASGHLVTEQQLAVAYEHNLLCSYLLGAETHEQFVAKREESRKEWLNLSTFSLRLYGIIEKIGIDQNLQHVLHPDEYQEFWLNITKRRISLRAFLRQEWFYDTRAKDHVYKHGPMMVRVPMYPKVTKMGRRYWFEQTRDIKDHLDSEEEYQLLLNWVRSDRTELPPSRALVEDDPFIIEEIKRAGNTDSFCVVTDDIALCRQAYLETRKWVCRVPVKWYYMSLYFGEGDEPWLQEMKSKYPFYEWRTILDEGSIKSYEELGFRDGVPLKWPVFRPFSLTQRSIKSGRNRIRAGCTKAPEEEDYSWRPYRFPDGYLFAPGLFLPRRNHPFKRGFA